MKNLLTTLTAALCALFCASAQDISLGRLTADGNRVYVEFIDVRNNIEDDAKPFIAALKGPEWNRWQVVDDKADADFVLRIRVEKKGSGFSISWGARMFTTVSILTTDDRELWRAKLQKGRASEFTGFNAQADAARKVVRRSLGEELQEAITAENGKNE